MEELGFSPSPAARRLSLGRTLTDRRRRLVPHPAPGGRAAPRRRCRPHRQRVRPRHLQRRVRPEARPLPRHARPVAAHRRPPRDVAAAARRGRPALAAAPVPVVFIDVHTPSVAAHAARGRRRRRRRRARRATSARPRPQRRSASSATRVEDPFGFTSSRDREAGPDRRAGDAPASRSRPSGSVTAPTAATRRATSRAGCSPATDDRRRSSRPATRRRSGVIAAARELGLHVPDDLSVIGYDDIEAADYVGLTTVRQQLFESGRLGAEILLAEIERPIRGAAGRPPGARARGPRDHGASEGGPWMRTPRRLGTR